MSDPTLFDPEWRSQLRDDPPPAKSTRRPRKPAPPRFLKMSEVPITETEWLWEPFLAAGKLSLVEGDPGTGKSTLSTWIAAAVTCGQMGPPSGAIVVNLEDTPGDVIGPRLRANGAGRDR